MVLNCEEHVDDNYGLFDNDEDNLTLLGKIIMAIQLGKKKKKNENSNRMFIILFYARIKRCDLLY